MHQGVMLVKAITIRDIPPRLAREISERARLNKTSFNRTVIDMLTERQQPNKRKTYHDLDHLAGTWSNQEADAFAAALKGQRTIDPEDWK